MSWASLTRTSFLSSQNSRVSFVVGPVRPASFDKWRSALNYSKLTMSKAGRVLKLPFDSSISFFRYFTSEMPTNSYFRSNSDNRIP